jgi:hypothetical protein
MATGEARKTKFLDKRNQIIFNNLEHLKCQLGEVGTRELITYLAEYNLLEAAGGSIYIEKVFDNLEMGYAS